MTRRELPYWWNQPCFVTFLGIFPHKVKVIIFAWKGACEVCLKRTSENSELGKTQISFWGGGEHWWVWQGVGVQIRSRGRVWGSRIDHGGRVWGSHEVGVTRGGCHMRWVSHEVGVTWGGCHARWVSHEVGVMQGECHVQGECPREVGVTRGGLCEVGVMRGGCHARWVSGVTRGGCHIRWVSHEVGVTRGECHARWVSCEVDVTRGGCHARWVSGVMRGVCHVRWVSREVSVTRGGCHMRWVSREVGVTRGGCHVRWVSREVGYMRGGFHARYESPSEMFHSLIFYSFNTINLFLISACFKFSFRNPCCKTLTRTFFETFEMLDLSDVPSGCPSSMKVLVQLRSILCQRITFCVVLILSFKILLRLILLDRNLLTWNFTIKHWWLDYLYFFLNFAVLESHFKAMFLIFSPFLV